MIYLDYAATTPVNKEVLDSFNRSCIDYIANPNSLHLLGIKAKNLIEQATKQIANILKVNEKEIIYTSGSTEANNLAIKGVLLRYKNRGNHIITTIFEHSSIYGPINYLSEMGFKVDFVNVLDNGLVDLDHLESLMTDETILVTISSVNSEVGILQPIEKISTIVKKYSKCFFHSDMTASIGKIHLDLNKVDMATFSPHKFYGLKGIGVLYKKENIILEPLIHGGKSTTVFRSGTPPLPLIVSCSKALRLAYENMDDKFSYVKKLSEYLISQIKGSDVLINSNENCLPHIINISIRDIKPETFVHALEEYDIYISTQTACSSKDTESKVVYALTKDASLAKTSLRISLSHLTTKKEIDEFIKCFNVCKEELCLKKEK